MSIFIFQLLLLPCFDKYYMCHVIWCFLIEETKGPRGQEESRGIFSIPFSLAPRRKEESVTEGANTEGIMSDKKPRMSETPERRFAKEVVRSNVLINSHRLKHPPTGKGWEAHTFLLCLKEKIYWKMELPLCRTISVLHREMKSLQQFSGGLSMCLTTLATKKFMVCKSFFYVTGHNLNALAEMDAVQVFPIVRKHGSFSSVSYHRYNPL